MSIHRSICRSCCAWGIVVGLIAFSAAPARAFADGPITAAIAAEQKIYDAFMQAKVVQQIVLLRDNYVASVRYYEMMRQVTSGKGVTANLIGEVTSVQNETLARIKGQFQNDWVKNPANGSQVDQAVNSLDSHAAAAIGEKVNALIGQMQNYGSAKVKVAEEVTNSSLQAQKTGKELALLSQSATESKPVSNADLLKALSVQIQVQAQTNVLLAQLLDVNSHTAQVEMNRQATALRQAAIVNNVRLQTQ